MVVSQIPHLPSVSKQFDSFPLHNKCCLFFFFVQVCGKLLQQKESALRKHELQYLQTFVR